MAGNSAQIETGINALVQNTFSSTVQNNLFNRMPLLYFLFAKDGDKMGPTGLGRPKSATFLSGVATAKAKRQQILSSPAYEPIVQTSGPAIGDGKVLGQRDRMPARSNWDTTGPGTYFTRPRVKWVERADPYCVPNKDIRRTTGTPSDKWKAIISLYEAETTSVGATHMKWWNQRLWGTGYLADGVTANTGLPTSEDAEVWDNLHSLEQMIHSTNTYCGVDRSVTANSYWRGNRVTAATAADFEDLINYCNYDLGFSDVGSGLDLIIVGGANFKKAKKEAKAKGATVMVEGGIQAYGQFGFRQEIVKIDNTWIVYDPECPATHAACLNLSTFTFAIHPDANFRVSKATDLSQFPGGDDASTGNIRTEAMMVCENPRVNAYLTNLS